MMLPANFEEGLDENGQPYYVNIKTGSVILSRPVRSVSTYIVRVRLPVLLTVCGTNSSACLGMTHLFRIANMMMHDYMMFIMC